MICKARNPMVVPQGGFFFVTDDQRLIRSSNLKALVRKVSDYYHAANTQVPDDIENEIICQICYRNPSWCLQEKSEGLGDTVAKVTRRTGIAPMLARVQGIVTGTCQTCNKRKKILNKAVPYRR